LLKSDSGTFQQNNADRKNRCALGNELTNKKPNVHQENNQHKKKSDDHYLGV
jgi:hypothetical protein